MAFGQPDPNQLYQAMQASPTQAAAAGLTAQQGQQAPGIGGNSAPGFRGASRPGTGPVQGNQGSAPVNPASYNTSFTNTSPQWYGQNNEYGTSAMASDPSGNTFWSGYSEDVMGLQPGSNAAAFLANKYNPMAIGNVMFGRNFVSDEQKLAGATSIANTIAKPGATFFNPASIIGTTLQALASGDIMQLAKQNPMIADLVQSNIGNPAGQIQSLITFFRDVLSATMPPDTLDAFLQQIQAMGQVFFSQMRKGDIRNLDSQTFAKFLMNTMGPTLGL